MTVSIKPTEKKDFDQVAQMVLDFFKEEKNKDDRTVVSNWDKIVPTVLKRLNSDQKDFQYYSVFVDDQLAGVFNVLLMPEKNGQRIGEILMWYVLPEYRQKENLEQEIVGWAVETLKKQGASEIKTEVLLTDEPETDLILSQGFAPFTGIFTKQV